MAGEVLAPVEEPSSEESTVVGMSLSPRSASTAGGMSHEPFMEAFTKRPMTDSMPDDVADMGDVGELGLEGPDDDSEFSRYFSYNQALKTEIMRLKKRLRDVEDDVEQLTLEKFKIIMEKDCTPSAMLFFSTLHDPNVVPTLQQLVMQFTALRAFADCSTHMDFVTLRKRLLVCSAATQTLENFIAR
jgi:hypothetical protein